MDRQNPFLMARLMAIGIGIWGIHLGAAVGGWCDGIGRWRWEL